jgi:hypothetical protein
MKSIFIIFFITVLVSGCAPFNNTIATRVAETITAIPTLTPYPTFTPYPTPTPYPTYTPIPTNTPVPTDSPTPTILPTQVYAKWTSNQVIGVFVDAGLEVGQMRLMTVNDYGMAPMLAMEGTRFYIPSLCADCGGRILSFDNQAELDLTSEYYISLGQGNALFFSWVFKKNNILVQINGDLPEAKARMYEEALSSMQ